MKRNEEDTLNTEATSTESIPKDPAPIEQEPRLRVGLLSISDRASQGVYQDQGIPALQDWLQRALTEPFEIETRLIPDERSQIEATLIELVDQAGCHLVLTTGGTGPAPRDVTPEATLAVGEREMPGFGEEMRRISRHFVPTAILSRQTAVIRGGALIVNLPGQPKAIRETLEGLRDADGKLSVEGLFSAIPYCLDLIGAPYVETDPLICRTFRPKSALRPTSTTPETPRKAFIAD
jgi:molybdopterin adenylyltransferase